MTLDPDDPRHGTTGGYSNHKCRCGPCRLTWNAYCAQRKKARRDGYVFDPRDDHGTSGQYQRGCKCLECKAAHAAYNQQLRAGEAPRAGVCEICGREGMVCWDHDHSTGGFRGWLCVNCNQGLGAFNDDPGLIERAVLFLGGVV